MKRENLPAYLFHQGTNYRAQEYLGAHPTQSGTVFRVWAPGADCVSLVCDANDWNPKGYEFTKITPQGLWELSSDSVEFAAGMYYKYAVTRDGFTVLKADPYAFFSELKPGTASRLFDPEKLVFTDAAYCKKRSKTYGVDARGQKNLDLPINIYECHLGSFARRDDGAYLSYDELSDALISYLLRMGYTHIELLPIMEHPFDGSWGYQLCSYFAPTSRFGTPADFAAFVDKFHAAGLGVILDWVPAHFPKDEHGLFEFDGAPLYEYQGEDRMEHRGWGTRCFDVGREEVQSFLISNALFWASRYHVDGLRCDAVASMLYLDYGREPGTWNPNPDGSNFCMEAIAFFQKLSRAFLEYAPDVLLIAEESTNYEKLTAPVSEGGLGFDLKWNMGWMNDTLSYVQTDPYFRKGCHDKLTFPMVYAFTERFLLPFSHDEVVHGKRSLIEKQWGGYEEKFASLRALMAYQIACPGKKLLFMGAEFAQFVEWNEETSLEWFLLDYPAHTAHRDFVSALNAFYLERKALWARDFSWEGFRWLLVDEQKDHNIIAFERRDGSGRNRLVCAFNFSPEARGDVVIPVSAKGPWREAFSTDEARFGGEGTRPAPQNAVAKKGQKGVFELRCQLPAHSAVFFEKYGIQ